MAEETKFSETSVQLTEAAPQTVDRFTAPGNIYSAILSRNEAVKDARRLKEFQELKDKYVRKKVIFEDPLFPAQDSSLFYSEKFPLKLEWKRPSEICSNPQFILGGANRTDICQGDLGDCWLLAAIACLTLNDIVLKRVVPHDQSFTENYAGIFHFQFWRYGEWVDVIVDDRLPTYKNQLVFTRSGQKNEFWSALLEKAYAKLHGSYEALKGGNSLEAMEDFTGGVTELYEITEAPKELYNIMRKALKRGSLMGCAIDACLQVAFTDFTLLWPHGIVKYLLIRLVRVRDPWGVAPPPACKSNDWAALAKSEQDKERLRPTEQGEFWMCFEEFQKNFTKLEICNLTPDTLEDDCMLKWSVTIHEGRWVKGCSAGGCRNFPVEDWKNVAWSDESRFLLRHSDGRIWNRIWRKQNENMDPSCLVTTVQAASRQIQRLSINFILKVPKEMKGSQQQLQKDFFLYNASIARSKSYVNIREVTERFCLKPGEYVIIPSTFDPHKESEFLLRVFSENKSTSEVIDAEIESEPVPLEEEEETEEEKQFRAIFQQIAGDDMQINANELRTVLNKAIARHKELKTEGFSLESCRSMIALMDSHDESKLITSSFSIRKLILIYRSCPLVFTRFDTDKSSTISSFEMRNALTEAGFQLNNQLYDIICMRYANEHMELDFDSYISCLVRLEAMFRTFRAFDKDGDGLIKLNVFELDKVPHTILTKKRLFH
ncbi:unnamed protein product [Leuciscus chuanchicus]